ncbi:ribosome small subunit-dependent GTPase A [Mycoplasmopsis opalescens]|uniref:ribosome small subunit-dependent GTPase A n=1 Tax=Mycoplasmopsis opalescens TaxID=114886 RepID=UPI0004A6ABE8|nr:ribosome small subunit-dependent GTPase A [Mycoplasmopsis opalescens]
MQGKIYSVNSGKYCIRLKSGEKITIPAAGVFRHKGIVPVVGDYVQINEQGFVASIEERKNEFIRPKVANIDNLIVVMSLKEPNFQPLLVDKYLAIIENKNIHPYLFITKSDLGEDNWFNYYTKLGYECFKLTNQNTDWIELIKPIFKNKTVALMGQSGVGKTTLTNSITGLNLETQEISKFANRGKHTTRIVQILEAFDGELIDTPGFSNIELNMDKYALANAYYSFRELAKMCKFKSCLHINEPKNYCNIILNVERGQIPKLRYENYLKLQKELENEK